MHKFPRRGLLAGLIAAGLLLAGLAACVPPGATTGDSGGAQDQQAPPALSPTYDLGQPTPTPGLLQPGDPADSPAKGQAVTQTPLPTYDLSQPTPTPGLLLPEEDAGSLEVDDLPTPIPQPTLQLGQPTPTPGILLPERPRPTEIFARPAHNTPYGVSFLAADGVKLAATFYPSTRTEAPALLLVHMYGGDRRDWRDLALKAQNDGYPVLALDLRGHGQSQGRRSLDRMAQDIEAGLEFLQAQDNVTRDRLAVIGAGTGANLALQAAAASTDLRAVVLLSPVFDLTDLPTSQALEDYAGHVLVAAAEDDPYSGPQAEALAEDAGFDLEIYPGEAFGTNLLVKEKGLVEDILEWLDAVL